MNTTKQDALPWKPMLALLIILLVAYLPLSTFYFGMKNDAFSDNFPQKYFLSQCLHAGVSPLWNPYLNFGFPAYKDMGFAFYSPVVWCFAAIGYSAYTLTIEVLLYIYIGGVGMYFLGRHLYASAYISLSIAAMYMCSGFYVGAIQHINSLAAAAFFPFVLLFLLRLLKNPGYTNSFLLTVAAYLVCASGHPAMPIACGYYLLVFVVVYFLRYPLPRTQWLAVAGYLGVSMLLFVLWMMPAIYSYWSVLPQYEHYVATTPYNATASASLPALMSFVFPFSTVAHTPLFSGDVSFRDFYLSLPGFVALWFGLDKKNKLLLPLLCSGLFLLLLSLGDGVKTAVYDHLPLVKNVRTNGHFRVFLLLSSCCIAGFGMERLLPLYSKYRTASRKYIIALICLLLLLVIVMAAIQAHELSAFVHQLLQSVSITQKIKAFYEFIPLSAAFLMSAAIAVAILLMVVWQHKMSDKSLLLLIVADLVVNCLLYLPVTGVGTTTVVEVQAVYNSNPGGFPIPPLIPVDQTDTLPLQMEGLTGSLSYYSKQIGIAKLTDYPSYFASTGDYFSSSDTAVINHQPYLFLNSNIWNKNNGGSPIVVQLFSPSGITCRILTQSPDTLVFLQNKDVHWHASINDKPQPIRTLYHTFQSVALPAGSSVVNFSYEDPLFVKLCWLSGLVFVMALLAFGKAWRDRKWKGRETSTGS